jgi:uncharacterized protein YicC (UPF0701 family)
MGIALGMKELTQDIASSYDNRAKCVELIKEEAKQVIRESQILIEDFRLSRKETSAQLRSYLVQDMARRKSEVHQRLTNFEKLRKEEGAQMRKDLAQGVAERRSEVEEIKEETQQSVKNFHLLRKRMSLELNKELSKGREETKAEVEGLLKEAQELVEDFQKARKKSGDQLRKDLAKSRANRNLEVKEMRNDFRRAQAEIKEDLKEGAIAWQELARTMQEKRTGGRAKKVEVSAEEEESSPQAEAEEIKIEIEEAPEEKEEAPDLEAKVLATVLEHPEGITLTEMGVILDVVPIVLGRTVKKLVDEGKIRKDEDKKYFLVTDNE